MVLELSLLVILCGSLIALFYSLIRSRWIYKQPVHDEKLEKIGDAISSGAMAFLSREYKVLVPFVLVAAIFLAIGNQGILRYQSFSFVLGASFSALAGFIGMKVATASNSRTTEAARTGINEALKIAFSGGSIMGMTVVGLALTGIFIVLIISIYFIGGSVDNLRDTILPVLSGFSLGASSMALFARVGGGIFTKAADVGADLVGKVEAGIPEDDHRNPATIADNVGDNVGDVAGMGADLFESYVGSLVGAMILGAAIKAESSLQMKLVSFPLLIAAAGVLASLIGIQLVRVKTGQSPQKALNRGTFGAAAIAAVFVFLMSTFFFSGEIFPIGVSSNRIFFSALLGMIAGVVIGLITEYFTGVDTKPVNAIVKACATGPATTLITGMGMGMLSALPPVLIIVTAILVGDLLAGLYGIAIAALGMLMTLGVQLAVDAYGPIADNAGGLAEMAEFPRKVREITDELDAVGNTTAAIGKGFAIGSAALTSIILFTAFREQLGIKVIDLMDVKTLSGVFIGAVIPYLFSSMAMNAIGDAAFAMIEEVRRQFREKPGQKSPITKSVSISVRLPL